MLLLALRAGAAPVICDPELAERLVVDARIDVARVPVTHPWLVPGLARKAADPATAQAVERICASGGDLFVERAESVERPGFKAYALVLSRVEPDGCALVHERVPLSIGIGLAGPTYTLRGSLPPERTPTEGCEAPAEWREERLVAGRGDVVRLVLVLDHRGDEIVRTHVVVRTASRDGWAEHVLIEPAPPRLLDPGASGPTLEMARAPDGQVLVALSHDRLLSRDKPGACRALGGQEVWQLGPVGVSEPVSGREALTLLARTGLWKLAGDDGYLLILAQDDEEDIDLFDARRRRLQKRDPEPLYLLSSSAFPKLNAGYILITPGPWESEELAREAKGRWSRSGTIKQAWAAPDPCPAVPR
jgi:hypothetical protein